MDKGRKHIYIERVIWIRVRVVRELRILLAIWWAETKRKQFVLLIERQLEEKEQQTQETELLL